MRRLLIIALLLLSLCRHLKSLPVQSQALENEDDQFFWQQAWFSSNNDNGPGSPFSSGESKKITAKSIFIAPTLVKETPKHYCPPGYLIDDIGKCIKLVSIQNSPEEILASRLINLIPADDVNSFFDYEYDDSEAQTKNDEQLSNLPALVPILNENENNSNFDEYFHENKTDPVEIVITTLSNDSENDTMTYEHASTTINNDESLITTTTTNDVDIYENLTTATTTSSDATINFDVENENAFLVNDSLIIASITNNNETFEDYSEFTTTIEPLYDENSNNSTGTTEESSEVNQPKEQEEEEETTTISDDLDSTTLKNESNNNDDRQYENKFVYHHSTEQSTSTTTTIMPPLSITTEFANKLLRFPSTEQQQQQRHRVRFPDDDEGDLEIFESPPPPPPISTSRSSSFSWPRESNNGGVPDKSHITKFWNQQPLISDYNAKNFLPFNSVRKFQILTPNQQQQRYNYQKK